MVLHGWISWSNVVSYPDIIVSPLKVMPIADVKEAKPVHASAHQPEQSLHANYAPRSQASNQFLTPNPFHQADLQPIAGLPDELRDVTQPRKRERIVDATWQLIREVDHHCLRLHPRFDPCQTHLSTNSRLFHPAKRNSH